MPEKFILVQESSDISETAPCRHQAAQEKPPDGEQEEAPARLLRPPPLLEEPEEKVDRSFSDFSLPHEGHFTCFSSSLRKHKYSKVCPQLLHLNS